MNSLQLFFALMMLCSSAVAFRRFVAKPTFAARNMITITEGVEFDTIAREWR